MSIGWLLLDGVLVVIALVVIVKYDQKGFVQGLISFIGFVLAIVISALLADLIADWIYDRFIHKALMNGLKSVGRSISGGQINAVLKYVPAILLNLLTAKYGDSYPSLLQNAVESQKDAASYISESIVAPAVTPIMTSLIFFVLFLLLMIAVRLLSRLFQNVGEIPMVGVINVMLGAILGILAAILVLSMIIKAATMLSSINGGEGLLIDKNLIRKSYIYRFFTIYNPLEMFFGLLS